MASLRDKMPYTAAWIDLIREVFCETPEDLASFNAQIRAGMNGQPTFWASENGLEVGCKDMREGVSPVTEWKPAQEPAAAPGARSPRRGPR